MIQSAYQWGLGIINDITLLFGVFLSFMGELIEKREIKSFEELLELRKEFYKYNWDKFQKD